MHCKVLFIITITLHPPILHSITMNAKKTFAEAALTTYTCACQTPTKTRAKKFNNTVNNGDVCKYCSTDQISDRVDSENVIHQQVIQPPWSGWRHTQHDRDIEVLCEDECDSLSPMMISTPLLS